MCKVNEVQLRRGHVVWAVALDESGRNPKERPHIILDSNRDIVNFPNQIVAICCTTKPHNAKDEKFVYIGGPKDQVGPDDVVLRDSTWANSQWFNTIALSDITELQGRVPRSRQAELIRLAQSKLDQIRQERRDARLADDK